MSVRDPNAIALAFEAKAEAYLRGLALPKPDAYYREIRNYLQRERDKGRIKTGHQSVRILKQQDGSTLINVGPSIYKNPCQECIQFQSTAELSLGITLSTQGSDTELLSYRFHLQLPERSGLSFVRIDLNGPPKAGHDHLQVPRSHVHPGFEEAHIPFPVMTPLEVLDRIFHVIEPHFA